MRSNRLLIGLVAGLASAVVFVSANAGPLPLRALLFFLTPLPLYIAGLGWGWLSALVGGVISALVVAAAAGSATGALTYAGVEAAPAVVLTYLATLHRVVPAPAGGVASVEWYPVGRIVIASGLIAAILALLTLAVMAESREALLATLKKFATEVLTREGGASQKPDPHTADEVAAVLYQLLPFAMGSILLNLWTAGRITAASGRLERPWPDIPSTAYPPGTPLLLAVALAAWMLPEPIARLGAAFSGALVFAYVLVGLAIIHYVTRGQPWRPFILWALYVALVILNTAASLLIALLGLAESFSRFRRTPPPAAPGPPSD